MAVKGQTARIPCHTPRSSPTAQVQLTLWYKDGIGRPIHSYDSRSSPPRSWSDERLIGFRATYIPDGDEDYPEIPYLKLEEVTTEDAGVYTCRVDYKKAQTQRAEAKLIVITPPGTPTILREDGTQVQDTIGPYNEGTNASITCQVVGGHPPPNVNWWHREKLLDGEIDSRVDSVYRNVLQVGPITRKDLDAFYVCQTVNSDLVTPISSGVTLDVNLPPLSVEVLGSGQALVAGEEYEVTCQSTGARPPATITWWLDGEQLINESSRIENQGNATFSTLTLVPEKDYGGKILKCLAQSPVLDHHPLDDTWELDVHYVPEVNLELLEEIEPNGMTEGENVTMICNLKANPVVKKVSWYHKGNLVRQNATAGVIVKDKKLKLRNIQRQQAGHYSCVATNIIGTGNSEPVVLKVNYVPVCSDTTDRVLGAAKDDEVQLNCRVNASPSQVTFSWYFRTPDNLIPIDKEKFTVKDSTSLLTYQIRKESDYGQVLCFAANEIGEQYDPCTFEVNPAGKPDAIDNCTLTNQTTDTLFVSCLPGFDGGLEQQFVAEVFEFDGTTRHMLFNITEKVEPTFTIEALHPGTSYLLGIYAENIKGKSEQRVLHGFTLPPKPEIGPTTPSTHIFPITPILGGLICVVGFLVLVAIVVVVVMKLRGNSRRAKERHDPASGIKNSAKDEVEYAEITFNNGKNKQKGHKKQGASGANGTLRSSEDSTIYATIDHTRTAQQQQEHLLKQQRSQQLQGTKTGKQTSGDLDSAAQREPDEIPLMDGALESSV
ncbi:kin of IRRE-like protein 1 isoform X2 [Homarus americanus]|uniref:kin of IRRE-like protein 1 isoform X2 n=1 Tax=Homarus americanus TaxID=6706 RepID=UPI001C45FCBD|nr:kin of IRRE-like protein 1 isoform X2 [Homarus americanus]